MHYKRKWKDACVEMHRVDRQTETNKQTDSGTDSGIDRQTAAYSKAQYSTD